MRTKSRRWALLLAVGLMLAACSPAEDSDDVAAPDDPPADADPGAVDVAAEGTIEYWLWDSNQLPAYENCKAAFEEQNPDLTIEISQLGWFDYWDGLNVGFVSGEAPDVFTNHLARYPEFASNNQLLPIDEFVARDNVDEDRYFPGLADLWVDPNGDRYGLPKDWDTIAVFYNKAYLEEAGLSEDDLWNMTWNPDDGGTFEEIVARLSVDANGVRGDEPGFDPSNVEVFGLGLENGGNFAGQTQWSHWAASTGWQHTDVSPWGSEYQFDDPRIIATIDWWSGLIDKGYMTPLDEALAGVGYHEAFGAGRHALATNGSWMTRAYFELEGVEVGLAPLPAGPEGRASMFNGLADSIYVGTDNPEASWQWVKFLASPECQNLVGEEAVVFPAIPESLEVAEQRFADQGIDISAFTIHVEENTTFLYPITDRASDVFAVMEPTMDTILSGQDTAESALTQANQQVNALFD